MSSNVRLGWAAALVIAGAQFSAYADRAMTAAFAPALRIEFALSDAQLGVLHGTALILPYALGAIVASLWLHRACPFRVMGISTLVWSLAAGALAIAPSYQWLLAARALLGLAQSAFTPAALSVLAASANPPRTVAVSLLSAGSAGGRSGGLLVAGLLLILAAGLGVTEIAPWRFASLAMVVPSLALGAVLFGMSRASSARARGTGSGEPAGIATALAAMAGARRAFASYVAAAAAVVLLAQSAGAWVPSILNRRFGLAMADSAILAGAVVLVFAPAGNLLAGHLAKRFAPGNAWQALLMPCGAATVAAAALAIVLAPGLAVALIAVAALVAGSSLASGSALIGFQALLSPQERFATNALFLAAATLIGYSIGPWLTGAASDRMHTSGYGLDAALFAVEAGCTVLIVTACALGRASWGRRMAQVAQGDPQA